MKNDIKITVDKSNPGVIRILFDHVWHRIDDYHDLRDYKIVFSETTPNGIYQILEYTEPNERSGQYIYKLVNYAASDSGEMSIWSVDLCKAEAEEITKKPDLLIY